MTRHTLKGEVGEDDPNDLYGLWWWCPDCGAKQDERSSICTGCGYDVANPNKTNGKGALDE